MHLFYPDYDRERPSTAFLGNDLRQVVSSILGTAAQPTAVTSSVSPKKKGFFRKGGGFWDILGSVGDAITGHPVYANALQDRRSAEEEARRRREDYDYWVQRQQWMLDHFGSLESGRS
jgi:hypothetical protein